MQFLTESFSLGSTRVAVVRTPGVRLMRRRYRLCKRGFDLALGLVLLPVLLPVMLLVALCIWWEDRGRILFPQWRTGKGGTRFRMYKFRTMRPDAEQMKQQLWHLNELTWPDFKISADPRVTRVGRFLRKTSLDELPQLFNVLKGDMSFVGPRPTSFDASTYQLWQTERLEVLPGITGLWQVSGRSNVDFDRRLELDVAYIETQSLALDVRILLRTVAAVLRRDGAC